MEGRDFELFARRFQVLEGEYVRLLVVCVLNELAHAQIREDARHDDVAHIAQRTTKVRAHECPNRVFRDDLVGREAMEAVEELSPRRIVRKLLCRALLDMADEDNIVAHFPRRLDEAVRVRYELAQVSFARVIARVLACPFLLEIDKDESLMSHAEDGWIAVYIDSELSLLIYHSARTSLTRSFCACGGRGVARC